MNKKRNVALILVLIIAGLFRLVWLDKSPASLYADEIDMGYHARSLLETGRDYRGALSPFFAWSYNSERTPVPVWMTMLSTAAFKDPYYQVRGGVAVWGVVGVYLLYRLAILMTKKKEVGLVVGLVAAVNPWQIQFSRIAFEATVAQGVFLLGLVLFFEWIGGKRERYFWWSVIVLSLSVYTYRTMGLLVPLTGLILLTLFSKQILSLGVRKIVMAAGGACLIIGSFLYTTTIGSSDQTRIEQIGVIGDPATPIFIQRARELDSGDLNDAVIGSKAIISSKIFHNKPIEWGRDIAINWSSVWSPEFLFVRADPNFRHSTSRYGVMYAIDAIGLIGGLAYLGGQVKKGKREFWWLLAWLAITPIPAALTSDGAFHASRLFIFAAPLLLTTGLGWWQMAKQFKRGELKGGVVGLYVLSAVFFGHHYLTHYPLESVRSFGGGYREAMLAIGEVENKYERVEMVTTNDPPMLYYLFWNNIEPRLVQEYGTDFSKEVTRNSPLDKVKVADWPDGTEAFDYMEEGVLYLVTQKEFPADLRNEVAPEWMKVERVVLYPDKEVAFYLIAGIKK